MIVLVVGVPGVGKTSVINEAKKYLKYEFKVVSTGDIMFELAKKDMISSLYKNYIFLIFN